MKHSALILKNILKNLNIEQNELADKLGVSKQYISQIINGKNAISKKLIGKLNVYYNVSPSYLLTGEGEMFLDEQEKATLELPAWLQECDLSSPLFQEFAECAKEDPAVCFLFLKARTGNKQAVEELCNFLQFRSTRMNDSCFSIVKPS